MKRLIPGFLLVLVLPLMLSAPSARGQAYHTPRQVSAELAKLAAANAGTVKLYKIAESPGNEAVNIIEIGPEAGKMKKTLPAVFVAANMEGTVPIATEAALWLAGELVKSPDKRKDKTWYILPCGNPDGLDRYFAKPLNFSSRNAAPYNDDMDDVEDEDGPDDLNKDGYITQMRVKDPEGTYIPVESDPRLMRRADPLKGEKGIYKLYTEGIDNDKDGKYNEDPPGGIDIGINFPHNFKYFTKTGGRWAGSEAESYELFKFISDHKGIAMTITFGATNFCMKEPKGGRRGGADLSRIKIPARWAARIGADPKRTYSLQEVKDMLSSAFGGREISDAMIASMLGLGAVVNPLPADLKFYKEVNEQYKEFLKKNKLDGKRLDPARAKDGSFELWSYYHLGLHTYTMDFWTLPEPKEEKKKDDGLSAEKIEKMSKDDFLAIGEEKLDAFLKKAGAPDRFKAKNIMDRVKEDKMNPKMIGGMLKRMKGAASGEKKSDGTKKEKAFLAFSDKELGGRGFVDWKPFNHPQLGEVEIGGMVPYVDNTPPAKMIDSLVKGQAPWVFTLAEKLPHVKILKTETEARGAGVYEVKAWIENTGFLPYPTAMGKRNRRPGPVVTILEGEGIAFLNGHERMPLSSIPGYGKKMVKWLIRTEKKKSLKLKVTSQNAWSDSAVIQLGGK